MFDKSQLDLGYFGPSQLDKDRICPGQFIPDYFCLVWMNFADLI